MEVILVTFSVLKLDRSRSISSPQKENMFDISVTSEVSSLSSPFIDVNRLRPLKRPWADP